MAVLNDGLGNRATAGVNRSVSFDSPVMESLTAVIEGNRAAIEEASKKFYDGQLTLAQHLDITGLESRAMDVISQLVSAKVVAEASSHIEEIDSIQKNLYDATDSDIMSLVQSPEFKSLASEVLNNDDVHSVIQSAVGMSGPVVSSQQIIDTAKEATDFVVPDRVRNVLTYDKANKELVDMSAEDIIALAKKMTEGINPDAVIEASKNMVNDVMPPDVQSNMLQLINREVMDAINPQFVIDASKFAISGQLDLGAGIDGFGLFALGGLAYQGFKFATKTGKKLKAAAKKLKAKMSEQEDDDEDSEAENDSDVDTQEELDESVKPDDANGENLPDDNSIEKASSTNAGRAWGAMFEAMREDLRASGECWEERRVLDPDAVNCDDCESYAAQSWVTIGTLPEINTESKCSIRKSCRCTFEFRQCSNQDDANRGGSKDGPEAPTIGTSENSFDWKRSPSPAAQPAAQTEAVPERVRVPSIARAPAQTSPIFEGDYTGQSVAQPAYNPLEGATSGEPVYGSSSQPVFAGDYSGNPYRSPVGAPSQPGYSPLKDAPPGLPFLDPLAGERSGQSAYGNGTNTLRGDIQGQPAINQSELLLGGDRRGLPAVSQSESILAGDRQGLPAINQADMILRGDRRGVPVYNDPLVDDVRGAPVTQPNILSGDLRGLPAMPMATDVLSSNVDRSGIPVNPLLHEVTSPVVAAQQTPPSALFPDINSGYQYALRSVQPANLVDIGPDQNQLAMQNMGGMQVEQDAYSRTSQVVPHDYAAAWGAHPEKPNLAAPTIVDPNVNPLTSGSPLPEIPPLRQTPTNPLVHPPSFGELAAASDGRNVNRNHAQGAYPTSKPIAELILAGYHADLVTAQNMTAKNVVGAAGPSDIAQVAPPSSNTAHGMNTGTSTATPYNMSVAPSIVDSASLYGSSTNRASSTVTAQIAPAGPIAAPTRIGTPEPLSQLQLFSIVAETTFGKFITDWGIRDVVGFFYGGVQGSTYYSTAGGMVNNGLTSGGASTNAGAAAMGGAAAAGAAPAIIPIVP